MLSVKMSFPDAYRGLHRRCARHRYKLLLDRQTRRRGLYRDRQSATLGLPNSPMQHRPFSPRASAKAATETPGCWHAPTASALNVAI